MPEENNRIIADNCSSLFFVPTKENAINLQNEGINHKDIHVTGNTIVDACKRNLKIAIEKSGVKDIIKYDKYIVLTLHRAENVDNPERLKNIVRSLLKLEYNIVFPLHPHTKKSLEENDLYEQMLKSSHIQITKPLGYLDFLYLLSKSSLVLTDSGGIQEESITLNIPCVTLRYNTERPETISAGGNILAGTEEKEIKYNIESILNNEEVYEKMANAVNPYGNGDSSEKIYSIIKDAFENNRLKIKSSDTIVDFEGYLMKNITNDITVEEFENENKNQIIEQIFYNGLPEFIDEKTNLKNKSIIIKKFKQRT